MLRLSTPKQVVLYTLALGLVGGCMKNRKGEAEDGPDVYRMLLDGELDVVTFTSASAVRNFAQIFGAEQAADLLSRTCVATIGPVTSEAAARLGIQVTVQASTYTVPALVEAIVRHVTAAKAGVAAEV